MLVNFENKLHGNTFNFFNDEVITKPTEDLTTALHLYLDEIPVADVLEVGKALIAKVNKIMYETAVYNVLLSENAFQAMHTKATYGAYQIRMNKDQTQYALSAIDVVTKKIENGKDADGKKKYIYRPNFIEYREVNKMLLKVRKALNDKKRAIPCDFNQDQKRLVTIFIYNLMGKTLSNTDKARLEKLGPEFKRFTVQSKNALYDQVTFFYECFNARTGLNLKPVTFIIDKLRDELKDFSSKFYVETIGSEVDCISFMFNHYINSEVQMLERAKHKKLENVLKLKESEDFKKIETESKAKKSAETIEAEAMNEATK